jgi:hypothetical protein
MPRGPRTLTARVRYCPQRRANTSEHSRSRARHRLKRFVAGCAPVASLLVAPQHGRVSDVTGIEIEPYANDGAK